MRPIRLCGLRRKQYPPPVENPDKNPDKYPDSESGKYPDRENPNEKPQSGFTNAQVLDFAKVFENLNNYSGAYTVKHNSSNEITENKQTNTTTTDAVATYDGQTCFISSTVQMGLPDESTIFYYSTPYVGNQFIQYIQSFEIGQDYSTITVKEATIYDSLDDLIENGEKYPIIETSMYLDLAGVTQNFFLDINVEEMSRVTTQDELVEPIFDFSKKFFQEFTDANLDFKVNELTFSKKGEYTVYTLDIGCSADTIQITGGLFRNYILDYTLSFLIKDYQLCQVDYTMNNSYTLEVYTITMPSSITGYGAFVYNYNYSPSVLPEPSVLDDFNITNK